MVIVGRQHPSILMVVGLLLAALLGAPVQGGSLCATVGGHDRASAEPACCCGPAPSTCCPPRAARSCCEAPAREQPRQAPSPTERRQTVERALPLPLALPALLTQAADPAPRFGVAPPSRPHGSAASFRPLLCVWLT
jgi:hypothetical protein